MPVYDYQALDSKGKTVSGIIDADGVQAARQKIRAMGSFPVSVAEVTEGEGSKESRTGNLKVIFSRVTPAQVSLWTRQLATLTGAAVILGSAPPPWSPSTPPAWAACVYWNCPAASWAMPRLSPSSRGGFTCAKPCTARCNKGALRL